MSVCSLYGSRSDRNYRSAWLLGSCKGYSGEKGIHVFEMGLVYCECGCRIADNGISKYAEVIKEAMVLIVSGFIFLFQLV